jgi:hypothetical protein
VSTYREQFLSRFSQSYREVLTKPTKPPSTFLHSYREVLTKPTKLNVSTLNVEVLSVLSVPLSRNTKKSRVDDLSRTRCLCGSADLIQLTHFRRCKACNRDWIVFDRELAGGATL